MICNDAIKIWKAGVAAVHGRTLIEKALRIDGNQLVVNNEPFDLQHFDRILVVGGGKFSHFMAEGIESVLGESIAREKSLGGFVTVPDRANEQVQLNFIEATECRPAGVNLPTQRVLDATERMMNLLGESNARTLVLALISGGGSALLERSMLPLEDIIAATNWLSFRGANIVELNSVRIAMSDVKGGGLTLAMPEGTMIGLIVSDVPQDDLRFVSSGPTVNCKPGIFAEARAVIEKFAALDDAVFPESVKKHLHTDFVFPSHQLSVSNFLIGHADLAKRAAESQARALGYNIAQDVLESTEACEQIAASVDSWFNEATSSANFEKQCVVSLGEPIVEPGDSAGQGGRNQHCVLAAAERLIASQPKNEFCFLSAGTDGEDGNTTVAGAHVSSSDIASLATQEPELKESLRRFDSHPFLADNNLVFESGPTATNVADLRILLKSNS